MEENSPVGDLIDLEIAQIQETRRHGEPIDRSQDVPTDTMDAAEKVFFPHMWDPAQEKSKVQDIAEFITRDCGCQSPEQLLDLIGKMEVMRKRAGRPTGNLLEDTWRHVKELQFNRLQRSMI